MSAPQSLLLRGGAKLASRGTPYSQNLPPIRISSRTLQSRSFNNLSRRPLIHSGHPSGAILASLTSSSLLSSSIGFNKRTFFWGGSKPSSPSPTSSPSLDASPISDLVGKTTTPPTEPPVAASSTSEVLSAASTADITAESGALISSSSSPSPIEIPTTIDFGYLQSLGLEYNAIHPSTAAEWLLEHVHLTMQTPWWASIAIATLAVRFLLFPLTLQSQRTADRLQTSTKFTKPVMDELMQAYVAKDNERVAQKTAELHRVRKLSGAPNPLGLFYNIFAQGWVGYGGFRLLYDMAHLPVPGLENGGVSWFENIAVADPTYVLPVATWAIMSVSTMVSQKLLPPVVENPQAAAITKLVPFIAGASCAFFPGTVQIFIFVSAAFQSIFQIMVALPKVRRLLGLSVR